MTLDYPRRTNVIARALRGKKRKAKEESHSEEVTTEKNMERFKGGGKRPQFKESGQPREAVKVQETDFPLQLMERNTVLLTPDFSSLRSVLNFYPTEP